MNGKTICPDCKGNGFLRVPYEESREEVHVQCQTCKSEGELYLPGEDVKLKDNHPMKIQELEGKVKFLQNVCRRAGKEINELKDTVLKLEKIAALTSEDVVDKLRDAESRIEDITEIRNKGL